MTKDQPNDQTDLLTAWGEDLHLDLFTDPPMEPARTSSAARIAAGRHQAEAERRRGNVALAEQIRRRREQEQADPLAGISAAELHAAKALQHRTAEELEQRRADKRRREGRRP
jgi:hypothetical protein